MFDDITRKRRIMGRPRQYQLPPELLYSPGLLPPNYSGLEWANPGMPDDWQPSYELVVDPTPSYRLPPGLWPGQPAPAAQPNPGDLEWANPGMPGGGWPGQTPAWSQPGVTFPGFQDPGYTIQAAPAYDPRWRP